MSKIVVIIPAYNEDENIVRLSKKILKYIPQALIYIIDDTKEVGKVETHPKFEGRQMIMIIQPI